MNLLAVPLALSLCVLCGQNQVGGSRIAGGSADRISFSEVAVSSGLDHVSLSGEPDKPRIIDQIGQGLAWFDFDGDGWLDLFVPNGATLASWQGVEDCDATDRLFRNKGDGTFEDVTEAAGLGSNRWGAGVAVGDIDRDGDPDLYVCNLGHNQMWRNNGDGTFTDITAESGGDLNGVTPGAAFADIDLDGDLDLYVASYIVFDPMNPSPPFDQGLRGMRIAAGPRRHTGSPDTLFINDGSGTFVDQSEARGLIKDQGTGFTVLIHDMNGDDYPDIFVACDLRANLYYEGSEAGTFTENAEVAGLAFDANGDEQACMGVAIADLNGDQLPDFYVTNWRTELNALYMSDNSGFWNEWGARFRRVINTRPLVGWGVAFMDFDLDADEDLLWVNGQTTPQLENEQPYPSPYRQAPVLLRREGVNRWRDVSAQAGTAFAEPHCSRGAAFADYDEDGDVDFAVVDVDGPMRLFRNDTKTSHHVLKVQLEGTGRINPDAYGARVTVRIGDAIHRRWVLGASSYLCHGDVRAHFGLGPAEAVDEITVRWPGGVEETVAGPVAGDQTVIIRSGEGIVAKIPRGQPMPGWRDRQGSKAPRDDDEP